MDVEAPASLIEQAPFVPSIARWLDELPARVDRCRERFDLVAMGAPLPGGSCSFTAPARTRAGVDVVLKVQWPHPECEHEALALATWAGQGAVQLLDHDAAEAALLLERLVPGRPLGLGDIEVAPAVMAGIVDQLAVPGPPAIERLADSAARWRRSMLRWDLPPDVARLRDAAVAAIDELVPTQPEQVLVHQDLHGGNVLASERQPWLAIDPKPLVAERAFALAPVVRSAEVGAERPDVLRRFDHLVDALALDRARARGWCVAQTMAWSTDDGRRFYEEAWQVAGWVLDAP